MAQSSDEVRDTLAKFLDAVESLDLERIMSFFTDDAQMFSPLATFPARLDGREAIGKQFSAIVDFIKGQGGGTIKLEPVDLDVRELGPDAALLTFHLRLQGPLNRRSFVMTRRDGRWRIAHIHASSATPA
jgi:uncharacterized protein (TIGR02246 family)